MTNTVVARWKAIAYWNGGGYTGKRYGLPGGKAFRKCR